MMQVDDEVEIFLFQFLLELRQGIVQGVNFIQMRVEFQQAGELLFGEKMDFRTRQAGFQAAEHRTAQDNVADGGKTDDQDFQASESWDSSFLCCAVSPFTTI